MRTAWPLDHDVRPMARPPILRRSSGECESSNKHIRSDGYCRPYHPAWEGIRI